MHLHPGNSTAPNATEANSVVPTSSHTPVLRAKGKNSTAPNATSALAINETNSADQAARRKPLAHHSDGASEISFQLQFQLNKFLENEAGGCWSSSDLAQYKELIGLNFSMCHTDVFNVETDTDVFAQFLMFLTDYFCDEPHLLDTLGIEESCRNLVFAMVTPSGPNALVDACCTAMWGLPDPGCIFRGLIFDTLASDPRYEEFYSLADSDSRNRRQTWEEILDAASDQRKPLAAIHAFALSNVIRRPIVILEGRRRHIDVSDPTSMFGVYLPLLWRTAPAECWQKPLFISHDNGHYWAVVTGSQEGSDKLADLLRSSPFGLDQRRAQVRFQSPCVKDIEIAIFDEDSSWYINSKNIHVPGSVGLRLLRDWGKSLAIEIAIAEQAPEATSAEIAPSSALQSQLGIAEAKMMELKQQVFTAERLLSSCQAELSAEQAKWNTTAAAQLQVQKDLELRLAAAQEELHTCQDRRVHVTPQVLQSLSAVELDDLEDQLFNAQNILRLHRRNEAVDNASCMICQDRNRDTALVPCGHQLCSSCAADRRMEKCPYCRCQITSRLPLHA